jgi:hypothetical protein
MNTPSEAHSILDKVLSSQQSVALEHFNPAEIVGQILKLLQNKEADVLRRRFGLDGQTPETLEEIGRTFKVTRERIRQIERTAKLKLLRDRTAQATLHPVEQMVMVFLTNSGGMVDHETLVRHFLQFSAETKTNSQALDFLFRELFAEKIVPVRADREFRPAWRLKLSSLEFIRETIRVLVDVITKAGHPLSQTDILTAFRQTDFARQHEHQLTDDGILAALGISQALGRNPFGDYGLSSWGSILPRRMHDKIYLVLRKHGKPLHFTEITRLINEAGFGRRKAYPPTVHNELILNEQYVLVGRGTYALREWGYEPGVVADVLVKILQDIGRPMTRDELVAKVLEQRFVKRNTIHLALNNRQRFQRLADGRYAPVEHAENAHA